MLFLFCCSVAYSFNHPIHLNLNKKYYESWVDYHLNNIALIYGDVVVNNKRIPVFSDSSLVKLMPATEIREKIVLVK